jgi:putative tricarboxylic transport membrane protein
MSIMCFFGVVRYLMRKIGMTAAPMVLALVIGPLVENSLRQSLTISQGSLSIFFNRPISAVLVAIAFLSLFVPLFRTM